MAAIVCKCLSDLCTALCTAPCRLCSALCRPVLDVTASIAKTHFCLYLTVALGLNVPPIFWAAKGALPYRPGVGMCRGATWLAADLAACAVHVAAAFYLASRATSLGETVQTLCYDPVVALYLIVCGFFFVWLCVGAAWSRGGTLKEGGGECPGNVSELVSKCLACGFAFSSVAGFVLLLSVCCSMCTGGRGTRRDSNRSSSYIRM